MCLGWVLHDGRGLRQVFQTGGLQEKPGDGGPASLSFWFPGQLLGDIYVLHSQVISTASTHSPGAAHAEGGLMQWAFTWHTKAHEDL